MNRTTPKDPSGGAAKTHTVPSTSERWRVISPGRPLILLLLLLLAATPTLTQEEPRGVAPQSIRRISFMGPEGDLAYAPLLERPDVAYNPNRHEYFVVWTADDDATGDGVLHVFGRRFDALTSSAVGPQIQISSEPVLTAPRIAFHPTENNYYVVWVTHFGVDSYTVSGQSLDEFGVNNNNGFGNGFSTFSEPVQPAIAYSPTSGEVVVSYLRLRFPIDPSAGLVLKVSDWARESETELLDPTYIHFDTLRLDLACAAVLDHCVGVWSSLFHYGNFNLRRQVSLAAIRPSDLEVLADPRPISDAGDNDPYYEALDPSVAYDSRRNQYLAVWHADENYGGLVDGEFEIFGQLIDGATFAEVGPNDFRISDVGGTGSASRDGLSPDVVYVPASGQFLVAYYADDPAPGLANNEYEIFHQWLDGAVQVGPNDLRYSAIEGTGNAAYDAAFPVLATDGTAAFNALWAAMVWRISMFDFYDEVEIFGQKIDYWIFGGGFEDGTLGSWSASTP